MWHAVCRAGRAVDTAVDVAVGADGDTVETAAERGELPDGGRVGSESPGTDSGPGRSGPAVRHPARAPEPKLRRWATCWAAGVAQALGAALLLISEFVRTDVADLGQKVRAGAHLPHYAEDFTSLQHTLDGQGWYRLVADLSDAFSFGEPRAALWAAVCAALVVRFNTYGPPRVQCFLSLAAAVYSVVAALAGIPYLSLAGFALPFVLVLAIVALTTATRRPPTTTT